MPNKTKSRVGGQLKWPQERRPRKVSTKELWYFTFIHIKPCVQAGHSGTVWYSKSPQCPLFCDVRMIMYVGQRVHDVIVVPTRLLVTPHQGLHQSSSRSVVASLGLLGHSKAIRRCRRKQTKRTSSPSHGRWASAFSPRSARQKGCFCVFATPQIVFSSPSIVSKVSRSYYFLNLVKTRTVTVGPSLDKQLSPAIDLLGVLQWRPPRRIGLRGRRARRARLKLSRSLFCMELRHSPLLRLRRCSLAEQRDEAFGPGLRQWTIFLGLS